MAQTLEMRTGISCLHDFRRRSSGKATYLYASSLEACGVLISRLSLQLEHSREGKYVSKANFQVVNIIEYAERCSSLLRLEEKRPD